MKISHVSNIFKKQVTKRRTAAVILVLVVFFFFTRGAADKSKITTTTVKKQDIVEEVFASGVVKAQNQTALHFPFAGKIVWVNVKEGDQVFEGQALASLDSEKYQIALRQAQQDVLDADAKLAQVYDDISKASGAESFQNRIKRTTAEAEKNKAFDNLKAAQKNLRDTVLLSPISGKILSFNVLPGQEVLQTTEIAVVGTTDSIEFTAEVDETDVVKIKIGDLAKISLDALEDKELNSSVAEIADIAVSTETGATAYDVKIPVPASLGLKIGMNGEARIESDRASDVISIPIEAVIDDKYVYVFENGKYKKKEVGTGLISETDIEVKHGLSEGQQVVTSGFDEIDKKSNLQKILGIFR